MILYVRKILILISNSFFTGWIKYNLIVNLRTVYSYVSSIWNTVEPIFKRYHPIRRKDYACRTEFRLSWGRAL